ncbi:spore germination protein [Geosporobacter ferrireducens]|uniref:Spore gernimation protein n=1 Tax=Geosporobacter ferrireducens TaxID=1424294 RepID=A0A1D8GGZ1_9FIRM|nr:spore germination protein [Geosporobacter ferrireducens]AOT70178.1 spore gernimation protein [Geosporobacter ferrireducens]MTI53275.1 spore germination protein [Geosporobacter ferrireducens]
MSFFEELFSKKKEDPRGKIPVEKDYEKNLESIKEILKGTDDVVYREFKVGQQQKMSFATIFVDGLADKDLLNENVLKSLMLLARMADLDLHNLRQKIYEVIKDGTISVSDLREVEDINEAVDNILSGETVLILDKWEKIVIIATKKWPSRSVSEPSTETVIRGAREGFTETMRMNTALVRRRIRDPKFSIKQMQIGRRSKTDIAVMYIEGIVNKPVLKMVKERLDLIDIDTIMESGYIEQLIEDEWRSPFPQLQHTQRPDVVAAALYEGRVAILIDNTPFALVAPATITTLLQSPEDYYERFFIASAVRGLRYLSILIALILPALYIAVTSYHPGMLPTALALYVAGSRNNVPFPAFLEAFLMEGALELLREAGIRLPAPIGATIGIVGGLVLGQAAVEAGVVSPLMVIVVALTAMAAYASPSYSFAIAFRLLRFILMASAAVFGLYGVILSLLMVITHLCNLKSFGVPYMSPYTASSTTFNDFKDAFIRVHLRFMKKRPQYLHQEDNIRMKTPKNDIKKEDDV